MRLLQLAFTLSFLSLSFAWTTYVVPYSGGLDDSPALAAAFSANANLSTNATILFQKGVTYNILTPIVFPRLQNVLVSVQGNLSYAADIVATQKIVASSSYSGHWFSFNRGYNVTLEGSTDPLWGWVNSHGQQWWDAMQNLTLQVNRPFGWSFHGITNGEIKYMKLWQPVAWSFSTTGSQNMHFHHNKVLAVSSTESIPYNTDGFSAQGDNILFENNVVFNGDDCLTVSSPATNIHFRNSYCKGGGLSIGSLGQSGAVANVQNVLMENVVLENALFGAMFKSWRGGNGIARNVTWSGIHLKKVKFPIYVTQSFWDQDLGNPEDSAKTTSTYIDTFTFHNFQGTIDDEWNNHAGISLSDLYYGEQRVLTIESKVITFELYKGTVTNIVVKNVNTTTITGTPVTVVCDSTTVSNDVGFKCWNGPFQATAAGQ